MGATPSRLYHHYHRHPRLALAFALVLGILLLSSLHTPDPTSPSFQLPSLLPSHYPPSRHPSSPLLNSRLTAASESLKAVCSGPNEPVYLDPGLTAAQERRYSSLRKGKGRVMIVTTIREIQAQLPDLLNTLIVLAMFLGPSKLAFSILEGPSGDCTPTALEDVVRPTLLDLGVPERHIRLITRESKIDFGQHNRIEVLAGLRNRALEPLWDTGGTFGEVDAVVMLNDVFLRAVDVLELLHQHKESGAGMTTAWDWMERDPGYYYDVWVGRTIDSGDLFYPISWSWWSPSDDLFPTSPSSKKRWEKLQPFQAYSSWNGMVVLDPAPFLPPHNVRFRRSDLDSGECAASECSLIAQDFWKAGSGKVQVVPSVQLAYTKHVAQQTRDALIDAQNRLGWVDGVPPPGQDTLVQFADKPPDKVRCHPWPEKNGLSANVWETTRWVHPYTGQDVKASSS